jgi:hypothetical protein
MLMAFPLATPSKDVVDNGVACVTARDFRWEKCNIKSISLLGNVLARQISRRGRHRDHPLPRTACSPRPRPPTSSS